MSEDQEAGNMGDPEPDILAEIESRMAGLRAEYDQARARHKGITRAYRKSRDEIVVKRGVITMLEQLREQMVQLSP
jgi:uncharacterized protein involved in exopolysaccharide biosynthesis